MDDKVQRATKAKSAIRASNVYVQSRNLMYIGLEFLGEETEH